MSDRNLPPDDFGANSVGHLSGRNYPFHERSNDCEAAHGEAQTAEIAANFGDTANT
jgi:hypothetical protein